MILNNRKYGLGIGYFLCALGLALFAGGMCLLRPSPSPNQDNRTHFGSTLDLRISRQHLFQLRLKREEAIQRQILFSADADWVRAHLQTDSERIPVKIRLKGDWTDHLKDEKWSFRVKCDSGMAWKGLRVFSLQSPHTRAFLHEWALHRFLEDQELLTTRYDFVHLRVNGADLGVYAVEEHFSKELLESRGRREGPIMKFEEGGLWSVRDREFQEGVDLAGKLPVFPASTAMPFQPVKGMKDPVLAGQIAIANNLMFQYQQGTVPFDQLFDLEAMGKRQAILDVFGAHHALYWSNTRFYYNPFTSKLEPVIFDGFAEPDPQPVIESAFLGVGMNERTSFGDAEEKLGTLLFAEPAFLEAYYGALHQFDSSFLEDWLVALKPETEARKRYLKREYLLQKSNFDLERNKIRVIQSTLEAVDLPSAVRIQWLDNTTLEVENQSPLALKMDWLELQDSSRQVHYLEANSEFAPLRTYTFTCIPDRIEVRVVGAKAGVEIWNRDQVIIKEPLPFP